MGRKLKRINWWIRRRSHLPVLLLAGGVVALLIFNEETSTKKAKVLDARIAELNSQIKQAEDSVQYYVDARQQLLTNSEELEHVAREQYGFQLPTEDVYLVK